MIRVVIRQEKDEKMNAIDARFHNLQRAMMFAGDCVQYGDEGTSVEIYEIEKEEEE